MKIAKVNLDAYKNQKTNFKGTAKDVTISFSRNDMESGSIVGSSLGLIGAMGAMTLNKNKSMPSKALIGAASIAIIDLATIGAMTLLKLAKSNKQQDK